jgi:hypothetical protein
MNRMQHKSGDTLGALWSTPLRNFVVSVLGGFHASRKGYHPTQIHCSVKWPDLDKLKRFSEFIKVIFLRLYGLVIASFTIFRASKELRGLKQPRKIFILIFIFHYVFMVLQ